MIDHNDNIEQDAVEQIAVIGMAGRFPGAASVEEFWRNLRDGVESINRFTDEELQAAGVPDEVLNGPNFVKAGAVLRDMDMFDASFFGFSPSEAEITDPQHRLFLECSWQALEHAGYNPENSAGPVGVYAGCNPNDYFRLLRWQQDDPSGAFQTLIGNEKDFLATRVSHKLNLTGPSLTVQTGCSTSLVAVQLACQGLLNYQCTTALAGGVSVNLRQKDGYLYQEGMIHSPDGYCRAFDAGAKGTVLGQGVGIVVLKRLSEALADGDTIYAVIKGAATNNDGALKASYTAPSVDGQAEVIAMAQALSGVAPETVSYIEAHGTATSLGDPIEIEALSQVFRASTNKKGYCAIGSVKTNIGHLDAAAGVTGLIKTIQALHHKQLPPSLHFEKPNPNIDFANSPFYVNTKLTPWQSIGTPRHAGVSSFGIGGTNAHVVLEEAPNVEPSGISRPQQLLVLSAMTDSALDTATDQLAEHLQHHPEVNLADVAYTLQVGRKPFRHRRVLVAEDTEQAVSALASLDPQRVFTSSAESRQRDVVFMFPGQGSQYVNMGLELYQTEPTFREHIDRCCESLEPQLGVDLRDVLYPKEEHADDATEQLKNTAITQPALFVIEYALAQLWMSWGVRPTAMVGHSIGEYVAACLAGVFSLEDALSLIATRGRLIQQLPRGSMLAVSLAEEDVRPLLTNELSLAVINSPTTCVVSGPNEPVGELSKQLSGEGVACQQLHTSHAFHSHMLEPILESFTAAVAKISLNPPQTRVVSTVTGTWVGAENITKPAYWTNNLRHTVRFADCMQLILSESDHLLLEVGPGQTLSTLARQHTAKNSNHVILSSLRHPKEQKSDVGFALNTLGRLWLAGFDVDWPALSANQKRCRVPLPTYPFERQRYWPAEQRGAAGIEPSAQKPITTDALPATKNDLADWFHVPSWKRSVAPTLPSPEQLAGANWIVFIDEHGLGERLVSMLKSMDQEVITVHIGDKFTQANDRVYTLNPAISDDYEELFRYVRQRPEDKRPDRIVHLWSITPDDHSLLDPDKVDQAQARGLYSLLSIARTVGTQNATQPVRLEVITNNMHEVTGDDLLCPEAATVLGPCKVVPQEFPNIHCRSIDVCRPTKDSKQKERLARQLLAEINADSSDVVVAYRGAHRWTQTVEPVHLDEPAAQPPRLKQGGVYLIAGGLGGVGLTLAEYLAKTFRAKLILVGRSSFPARDQWAQWLDSHQASDETGRKIRILQAMEAAGSEVLIGPADVADLEQMREVVTLAQQTFGQINGVIHCAGVIDNAGGILRRTRETNESTIASKVRGTVVLDTLLRDVNLDFFVLCSSVATALYHNRFGQVGYVTANSFLDAFTHYRTLRDGTFTATINWDDWQEIGMTVRAEREFAKTYGIEDSVFDPVDSFSPAEGVMLFSRVLHHEFPRVLISTRDLRPRIEQDAFASSPFLEAAAKAHGSAPAHPRPQLSASFVAPQNETEQTIAGIWQDLLGVDEVGVHDDYFELGGDSLRATQFFSRLREAFQVELPPQSLFENPTIVGLAEVVETWRAVNHHDVDVPVEAGTVLVEGEI